MNIPWAVNVQRPVGDLALFGGSTAFSEPLFVCRPNIGERSRFFERLDWALDNRWLTNGGPLVRAFEERIAKFAGVRNCVATCNGTAALQLLIRALELSGEVIMPALTFVATAHAVKWLGLEPVFCDIDPSTASLDPAQVKAAITPRTTGIIGVHLWGRPCAVDELEKIAAVSGVKLIFDAAHALGCTFDGLPIGGFGAAEIFSFHATKIVNTFEGGAVLTNDDELARRVRAMHNFGFSPDDEGAMFAGTNAKMSEVAAAMGLTSLDAFESVVEHNQEIYDLYRAELSELAGVSVVEYDRRERNNYHYLIIQIDENVTGLHRDMLHKVLRAENVVTQRYFWPGCHQMEPYASERPVELPQTERVAGRVLALPTGPTVSREHVRQVCDIIRVAASYGHEVTARWRRQHHDA
jgi:dTDP-4-amino-4,6-dideoxyglucose